MTITLSAPSGDYNSGLAGRFGMTLLEAKEYLLKKAEALGLKPQKETLKDNCYWVDFYLWKRYEGEKVPWKELRDLACEFAVPYDHDGDPPWEYRLEVEEAPPEGQYKPV